MLVCTLCDKKAQGVLQVQMYNIGLVGHSQFVFAVVILYHDTTILLWMIRYICIFHGLYLDIHRCTGVSLHPYSYSSRFHHPC